MTDEPDADQPQLPEALLRALRAPGTPEELAGESDVLAAFREARDGGAGGGGGGAPKLRLVGRLGVGGVAAAATLVLGSGVAAAAYTSSLPEPVQRLAHRVLAPIGVPAAQPRRHHPKPSVTALPTASASPTHRPSPTPTRKPTRRPTATPTAAATGIPATTAPTSTPTSAPATAPTSTPTPSTQAPASTPTPSTTATVTTPPTGSPTATATPTKPPRPLPATVSLTLSATRVAAGSTARATGTVLDSTGTPVVRQRVTLQASTGSGWTGVATALTDRLGNVSLYSPAVTQNTRFRLKVTDRALSGPLLSSVVRVTEAPELIVTYASGEIQVSAVGAQTGDLLRFELVQGGTLVEIGTITLAGSTASFPVQQTTSAQRIVVVLPRTTRHAAAKQSVTILRSAGSGRGGAR